MKTKGPALAAAELLLTLPAALFMAALLVRSAGPLPFDAAGAAERIVNWYAGRMWTLWVLLLALPFAVLSIGCAALRQWNRETESRDGSGRTRFAMLLVVAATLSAGAILVVVVLHMAAN